MLKLFALLKQVYDDHYKLLLILPMTLLLLSSAVLLVEKSRTGEFIEKDISLKGGTLMTIQSTQDINIQQTEDKLETALDASVRVKEIKSATSGGRLGYTFEVDQTGEVEQLKDAIETASGLKLISGEYTIEEMSSALSSTFWSSTIKAIALAFFFMAGVVFIYFRRFLPSVAIILAAVSDLIGTLAVMNLLDIKLSTAGVAAMLMLLGYSVDTDILLSTRLLKRKDLDKSARLYSAVQTGLTMALTTISALLVVIILSPASVLRQITLILIIGLLFDLVDTWIQNAGLLRWYLEKKGNG